MSVDTFIIFAYLASMLAWAIYIGRHETADDFFVMSRRAPFFLIIFSVIATWVGVGTTVATASSAYEDGISLGFTALSGGVVGVVFVSWFAPISKWFGDKYEAYTVGDFFIRRYSKTALLLSSILIFIIYIVLTAAQFVGLTAILEVWSGIDFRILIWFAAASTIVYTAIGGIKSDFYTDVIHFAVMTLVMFFMLLPITVAHLGEAGGLGLLRSLPASYFDPFAYGGPLFFIAGLLFGAGSGLVTMELWQRIFAARSGSEARSALMISMVGIALFYVLSTFLGLAAKVLLPGLARSEHALFELMKTELPAGFIGLGMAGFIAIMVSTINSTIMVASATVASDVYRHSLGRSRSTAGFLRISRLITLLCGAISLCVALAFPDLVALSVNGMFMLLILLPSIVGGLFWKGATSKGAAASILGGFATLLAFMALDPPTAFVPGFAASALLFLLVSRLTNHDDSEDLAIVRGWRPSGGKR